MRVIMVPDLLPAGHEQFATCEAILPDLFAVLGAFGEAGLLGPKASGSSTSPPLGSNEVAAETFASR
jgi:hypothetical protein